MLGKAEDGRGREVEDRAREADGGEGRRDADREAEPEERFASKVSPVERRPGARRSAADRVEGPPADDEGGHVKGVLLGVAEADVEGVAGGREELAMAKGGGGGSQRRELRRWGRSYKTAVRRTMIRCLAPLSRPVQVLEKITVPIGEEEKDEFEPVLGGLFPKGAGTAGRRGHHRKRTPASELS